MKLASKNDSFYAWADLCNALCGTDLDEDWLLEVWTGADQDENRATNHVLDTPENKRKTKGSGGGGGGGGKKRNSTKRRATPPSFDAFQSMPSAFSEPTKPAGMGGSGMMQSSGNMMPQQPQMMQPQMMQPQMMQPQMMQPQMMQAPPPQIIQAPPSQPMQPLIIQPPAQQMQMPPQIIQSPPAPSSNPIIVNQQPPQNIPFMPPGGGSTPMMNVYLGQNPSSPNMNGVDIGFDNGNNNQMNMMNNNGMNNSNMMNNGMNNNMMNNNMMNNRMNNMGMNQNMGMNNGMNNMGMNNMSLKQQMNQNMNNNMNNNMNGMSPQMSNALAIPTRGGIPNGMPQDLMPYEGVMLPNGVVAPLHMGRNAIDLGGQPGTFFPSRSSSLDRDRGGYKGYPDVNPNLFNRWDHDVEDSDDEDDWWVTPLQHPVHGIDRHPFYYQGTQERGRSASSRRRGRSADRRVNFYRDYDMGARNYRIKDSRDFGYQDRSYSPRPNNRALANYPYNRGI